MYLDFPQDSTVLLEGAHRASLHVSNLLRPRTSYHFRCTPLRLSACRLGSQPESYISWGLVSSSNNWVFIIKFYGEDTNINSILKLVR